MNHEKKALQVTLPDPSQRPSAAPMKHYCKIYSEQNPKEIAARTGIVFDSETSSFRISLLGMPYRAPHPDFDLIPLLHTDDVIASEASGYEKLLLIRYLTEGSYVLSSGKVVSYEELPWGSVYMRNFRGRVIGRLVREFGKEPPTFSEIVETMPSLHYERLQKGDCGYRIEFINHIYISIIYYEGDEEFPASFQVLFDDHIKYAFTAEDVAVVGDVLVGRLKAHRKTIAGDAGDKK